MRVTYVIQYPKGKQELLRTGDMLDGGIITACQLGDAITECEELQNELDRGE